jgi:hypothetical protein
LTTLQNQAKIAGFQAPNGDRQADSWRIFVTAAP